MSKKTIVAIVISAIIGISALVFGIVEFISLFHTSSQTAQQDGKSATTVDTSSGWITYNSVKDQFSVTFPTYPEITSKDVKSSNGVIITYNMYASGNDTTSTGYFLAKYIYSGKLDLSDPDKLLEAMMNYSIKGAGGSLIKSSYTYFGSYRALDFTAEETAKTNGSMSISGRVILVGGSPYLIFSAYPTNSYSDSDYQKFINSFKVDPSVVTESIGASAVSQNQLDTTPELYIDTVNGFSILPPRGYKKDTSRSGSLVAFSDNNGVMDINIDPASDDLSAYTDGYINTFKTNYPDFNLVSKKATTLSGKSAYKISGTFTFDSNKFILTAFAVKGDKNYFIEVQSSGSTWGTDEGPITSSLSSFKLN